MLKLITQITQKIEERAASVGFVYSLALRYYRHVVRREIDLADISDRDSILFIGGGVCPLSAILLHQCTGARVTVVDNNSDCVRKAGEVVERLGLCEQIEIRYGDGEDRWLSLDGYTVIHLALQVTPVEKVFAELKRRVSPGVKLLVRRPKNRLCSLYCAISGKILKSCDAVIHQGVGNIGSTLMYTKESAGPNRVGETFAA